ncbi:MAG: dTMP kinase [Oscillospiraceae bacterium]|jgi:dTMP kinase|nr:dTMP kinase [Oscillospiraceae bacterium]
MDTSPRYDTVLFDLDGTITDSGPGIAQSVRHVIDTFGLEPLDDAELQKFFGPSLHESFSRHLRLEESDIERAITVYRDEFSSRGILNNRVYKGLPNLLTLLKSQGASIILATAKPTAYARRILVNFGLIGLFDSIVGVPLDARDHDKADIVRQALPARYRRAVLVGDRHYDVRAAKANNIDSIGVTYGYGSEQEIISAGADFIARDVPALTRLLCGDAPPPQGLFITMEGLDAAGKTTQVPLLKDHLERMGWDVLDTREPGGCALSERIRELLADPDNRDMTPEAEAYLFAASRAQHVRSVIAPALAQGRIVLSDRFVDSSVAYQGGGRELGFERIQRLNEMAVGACVPDLVMLLMVDLKTALLRRESATRLDRIERAGEVFFQRVYNAFLMLAKAEPDRVHCVDASQPVEVVKERLFQLADAALRAHINGCATRAAEG